MKRLLALLFCLSAVAQSVDVVQTTSQVNERKWLQSATVTYGLDAAQTNVVMTQVVLNVRVERRIGAGLWESVTTQPITFTRDGATQWITSYTNAVGTVVTNNIRLAVLADCDRVDLLATRAAQLIKTPQAMAVPPLEVPE